MPICYECQRIHDGPCDGVRITGSGLNKTPLSRRGRMNTTRPSILEQIEWAESHQHEYRPFTTRDGSEACSDCNSPKSSHEEIQCASAQNASETAQETAFVGATEDRENGPQKMTFPRVTRRIMEEMELGESRILSEAPGTVNAGAQVQSYAHRADIKVTTHVCYIVIPNTETMAKAICVTRIW